LWKKRSSVHRKLTKAAKSPSNFTSFSTASISARSRASSRWPRAWISAGVSEVEVWSRTWSA